MFFKLDKTQAHEDVVVIAGRIGGFEYVGTNEEVLLVSINTSQRADETNWIRIPFRNGSRTMLEEQSKMGDYLTVVAFERPVRRGTHVVTQYAPLRFFIGRRNRIVQQIIQQAPQNIYEEYGAMEHEDAELENTVTA